MDANRTKKQENLHQQSDTPTSNTTLDANRKSRKTPRYALRGMLGSTCFQAEGVIQPANA
jgi:hypothetical protein